jgi:crotonobetainyl-CoA:carnitine CoA-transferase CaiB-like acyl-CoA transferase
MNTVPPYKKFPAHSPRTITSPLALENIKIIDFTRFLAGPYCTQTLADMGADVVKIENPGTGDETRLFQPPDVEGESPYFIGLNRNKKSICLNLANPGGIEVARDLIKDADILVENFSPGAMKRLGLSYEELTKINPNLIYCAITGYGSDSSHADQPGFDSVFQAESGFASLTGDADRLPMRTGTPIIDITAAMNATSGILAALYARKSGSGGQYVEVSMFDTALNLLGYFPMNYLASGKDPVRQGNTAPVATPVAMFETAEGGPVYVSCGSQKSWEGLVVGVLEQPALLDDPDFATNRDRNKNQDRLYRIITQIFLSKPRDNWITLARKGRVPIGAVRSIAEALNSPLAKERRIVTRVARTDGSEVPNLASPYRFSKTPVADPVPAPRLNENVDEILTKHLNYDVQRITELEKGGAFSVRKIS